MLLGKVYAMSSGQAEKMLTDYYHANKANDPLLAGSKLWQEVKVMRTLKMPSPSTYEVDYQTLQHSNNDNSVVATNWRATMQVATSQPTASNPLGLFVAALDFASEAK